MNYLVYNPTLDGLEKEGGLEDIIKELLPKFSNLEAVSFSREGLGAFLDKLTKEDNVILLGGDGTLNWFINHTKEDYVFDTSFYLYPRGTGNDFARDVDKDYEKKVIPLNEHLKHLPCVEVKGKTYRFINGVGYGIDGECCVKADELHAQGKKVNYSNITIGLLFGPYLPPNATATIDGKEYKYERAYLAPCMNGRYYGGGMMIAPDQKRNSNELTFVCIRSKGKLGAFLLFPSIFKGKHVKKVKHVDVHTGKDIVVSFDKPTALQIDGEVIKDVSSYHAYTK